MTLLALSATSAQAIKPLDLHFNGQAALKVMFLAGGTDENWRKPAYTERPWPLTQVLWTTRHAVDGCPQAKQEIHSSSEPRKRCNLATPMAQTPKNTAIPGAFKIESRSPDRVRGCV